MKPIEHGSYGGYQQCRQRPEKACADCRRANREYVAEWRQKNPSLRANHETAQAARDRALRRLAREFPARFQALYVEELGQTSEREAS